MVERDWEEQSKGRLELVYIIWEKNLVSIKGKKGKNLKKELICDLPCALFSKYKISKQKRWRNQWVPKTLNTRWEL